MGELASERIAVVGHFYGDSFAENIHRALLEMGARSFALDPRTAATRRPSKSAGIRRAAQYAEDLASRSAGLRRVSDRRIVEELEKAEPDLVISTNGYLFPDQVERWRERTHRAPWVLWYPDALSNLGPQRCFDAPWDRLFFKDQHLVDLLASHTSLPVHHLPEACLPSRHRTYEPATEEERSRYGCEVALAGNNYPYRVRVLERLAVESLRLYGHAPSRWSPPAIRSAFTGEYVTDRSKFLAFTEAKVLLNTLHYAEIRSANARLFEATGCGAFVITHANAGVRELYETGREVVAVDSAHELGEAIRHYLNADDERRQIAVRGQRRAHRDHTYQQRLRALIRLTRDG